MRFERIIPIAACVFVVFGLGLGFYVIGTPVHQRQTRLLPEYFEVYVGPNYSVIDHFSPGYMRTELPTVNPYVGEDGCYIVVYSRDKKGSAYSVAGGIYVVGQIRVQGYYQGRICRPKGYEKKDISASPTLKILTDKYFPGKKGGTWPGGDTGGWFDPQ